MVISAAQVTLLFLSWLRKEGSRFVGFVLKHGGGILDVVFPEFVSMWTGWPFFLTCWKKWPTGFVEQTWFLLSMPWNGFVTILMKKLGTFYQPRYIAVCVCIYMTFHSCRICRIHDLNPGLSLKNWGFCPPNVTPPQKVGLMIRPYGPPVSLNKAASLSLGAFCSRKLYALRCLGHHLPRWGKIQKKIHRPHASTGDTATKPPAIFTVGTAM